MSGAPNGDGGDRGGSSRGESRSGGAPGLDALPALYAAFAEAVRAAFATGAGPRAFEDFGARFFGSGGAGLPGVGPGPERAPGASQGPAWPGGTFAGPLSAMPAIGLPREQVRRAQRLETAMAAFVGAQAAQSALLARAGAEAGAAFATALTPEGAARDGLRAAFDRWIEHAETAWLTLAHSAAWCEAQARTVDAAIAVRAAQQEIADDAARLAGLPTLRDIDALHRRLRDVEGAANVARPAEAKRTAGAPRRPRARTGKKPRPAR